MGVPDRGAGVAVVASRCGRWTGHVGWDGIPTFPFGLLISVLFFMACTGSPDTPTPATPPADTGETETDPAGSTADTGPFVSTADTGPPCVPLGCLDGGDNLPFNRMRISASHHGVQSTVESQLEDHIGYP